MQGVEHIPFGISPDDLWEGACVEYASASYIMPCNRSDLSEELFATDGYNLQGYNRQGFDRYYIVDTNTVSIGINLAQVYWTSL